MAQMSSRLILSLVERVTGPSRAVQGAIRNMNQSLERNRAALDDMRGRMLQAGAVGYGLVKAIQAPTQAAIAFESAIADVKKVVDFASPGGVRQMSADILELSRRVPMAANGIADIVASAGQANIPRDQLLEFAELASKVGVAFDITGAEAGENLAKIKTALGLSVEEVGALSDALNHLSNTSASSAPDLLNFMRRAAPKGQTYGFGAEQTAALGSAMIAAGYGADVAATSFQAAGRALARGQSATGRQIDVYERLGLSAEAVAKSLQENAVGTLQDVITRIRALPADLRASTISDLFGEEADALAPLIENAALLEQALSSVASQANYLGSSQEEFEARAESTTAQIQLFQNRVHALSISIGSALLPAINSVMRSLGPVVDSMARFASANPVLTRSIIAVTGSLAALRVATIAMRFSFLWLQGGAIIAALGGLRLTSVLLGMLNPMNLVRAAMIALRSAFLLTGVGAVVAALAVGGMWIYKRWSAVTAGFKAFRTSFAKAMKPVEKQIAPVVEWITAMWERVSGLLEPAQDATRAFEEFGTRAGRAVGRAMRTIVDGVRNLPRMMGDLGQALREWLSTADWARAGRSAMAFLQDGISRAWAGIRFAWDWIGKITGSMTGLNWSEVGTAIGDGLRRYADLSAAIYTWLADQVGRIDAAKLGTVMAGAVVKAWSAGLRAIGGAIDIAKALVGDGGSGARTELQSSILGALQGLGRLAEEVVRSAFSFTTAFWSTVWQRAFAGTAQQLRAVAKEKFQAFVDGAKSKVGELITWFKEFPAKVLEAIGTIDLGAALTWGAESGRGERTMREADPEAGWMEKSGMGTPHVGARALGGPVAAGMPYLVNERTPRSEVIVPSVSGAVLNVPQAQRAMAMAARSVPSPRSARRPSGRQRSGPANVSVAFGDIVVQGGANASAEDISAAIGRDVGMQLRSHFSDGGI